MIKLHDLASPSGKNSDLAMSAEGERRVNARNGNFKKSTKKKTEGNRLLCLLVPRTTKMSLSSRLLCQRSKISDNL